MMQPNSCHDNSTIWNSDACQVDLALLLDLVNPVQTPPWSCDGMVRLSDVLAAIDREDFLTTPIPDEELRNASAHVRRIARLVKNGWEDPIEIDVGIPGMGLHIDWPVTDGNHRLYAAAVREDREILVSIAGSLDYAEELFELGHQASSPKNHP